jgi:hypothetical protein
MLNYLFLLTALTSLFSHPSLEVFNEFKNKHFVETGTYHGDGVQYALDAGFENIYSIEIDEDLFKRVFKKFASQQNVTILLGDSSKVLKNLIMLISEPITFWLDAHCPSNRALSKKQSPIFEELNAIDSHPIKTHTILIDDVRDMGGPFFDYVTIEQIKRRILQINPNYQFTLRDCTFKNDILVAYIP